MFGVPGGGPNLEKIGAGAAMGIPFTLAHGETAAAIMAATYGYLTGTPGLMICTRGPGIASAVNGLAQATLDRFPLVAVSDTVTSEVHGAVGHQNIDQVAMTRPVTKWSGVLGAADPATTATAAAGLATSAPQGAVHLDFDPTCDGNPGPALIGPSPPGAWPDAALGLITAARRPVIIIGAEAAPWQPEVRAFVADAGCPVLTTYQAAGLIPDAWPTMAGRFTSGALEKPLLDESDLVLAIGVDAVEPMPFPWTYPMPVVSLMPWPDPVAFFPDSIEVVGDLGRLLEGIPAVAAGWDLDDVVMHKIETQRALAPERTGFGPLQLVETLLDTAPLDAVTTVDAGAHFLAVMPFWPVDAHGDLLISNGLATMGFAVPAAIGAALARPGRPVLALVGDGGLGMTLAELETIVRLELDVAVVVFNDSALSLIEVKQTPDQGGPDAVSYRPTDFAAVSAGLGLPATRATSALEVLAAMEQTRPHLIDAQIDPAGYRDLIRISRG